MSLQEDIQDIQHSEEPRLDAIFALTAAYIAIDNLKKKNEDGDAAYRQLLLQFEELKREKERMQEICDSVSIENQRLIDELNKINNA